MIQSRWDHIGEKSALVLTFIGEDCHWDDYRQLATYLLQTQAEAGLYPANAIFDLRDCRVNTPELLYYLKKLLSLRSMPNLQRLNIIGNRKRHHMLAQLLDESMPYTVTFARQITDVQPAPILSF